MLPTRRLILGVGAIAVAALLSYGLSGMAMTPQGDPAEAAMTCGGTTECGGCPGAPPAPAPAPCKCAGCDGKCEECECDCEDGKCEGTCKDCDGKCEECKCACKDGECKKCKAAAGGAESEKCKAAKACTKCPEGEPCKCKPRSDEAADKGGKKDAGQTGSRVRPLAEAFNLPQPERSR